MIEQLSFSPFVIFLAGILSVASPCILPLLPAIMAYSAENNRAKPLLIIFGLSISFIVMGILTSAFGAFIINYIEFMQVLAALIIFILGIMLLIDNYQFFNVFSKVSLPSGKTGSGLLGALLLGISLGIVWIPCTGPVLGAVLAFVASEGRIGYGSVMLAIYSLGFAVPMLIIGYSTNITSEKLREMTSKGHYIKQVSGTILILISIWMVITYI